MCESDDGSEVEPGDLLARDDEFAAKLASRRARLDEVREMVEALERQRRDLEQRYQPVRDILCQDPEIAAKLSGLDDFYQRQSDKSAEKAQQMMEQQAWADALATDYDDHLCDLAAEITAAKLGFSVTFAGPM